MMPKAENIHIVESFRLVIVSHNGMLNKQSVSNVITELESNPFFQEEYFVLIDIRNADTNLTIDEIEDLSIFVYEKLNGTGVKKFAILATESQTNKTVHFVRNYKHSSKYQVFSMLEPALFWLKIPQDRKSQIEIKLDYLHT